MDKLRRFGKDAGYALAMLALLGGVIGLFGGRFPPWFTPAEAADIVTQQQMIADTVKKAVETLDKIGHRLDRTDCDRANEKLQRALDALKLNPNNPVANDLRQQSLSDIRKIDGCAPDVR